MAAVLYLSSPLQRPSDLPFSRICVHTHVTLAYVNVDGICGLLALSAVQHLVCFKKMWKYWATGMQAFLFRTLAVRCLQNATAPPDPSLLLQLGSLIQICSILISTGNLPVADISANVWG